MSTPVDLADLGRALDDAGAGYLLSTTGAQVKAVSVEPTLREGVVRLPGPGRGSLRNVAANPTVTLLFPPRQPRGYTLLIDGTATADGEDLRVVPTHAVLHRPAEHAAVSTSACGHDCHPV